MWCHVLQYNEGKYALVGKKKHSSSSSKLIKKFHLSWLRTMALEVRGPERAEAHCINEAISPNWSAHHFPSRFGVKQDHGDPFGLSVVCAVVLHPGRYERAWGRGRKDNFLRRSSEAGEEKIHPTTKLVLAVSMGTTPFTKVAPHFISQIHFCTLANTHLWGSRAVAVGTYASPAQTGTPPWCDGWRSCVHAGSPSSSSSETPPPSACSQSGSSSVSRVTEEENVAWRLLCCHLNIQ